MPTGIERELYGPSLKERVEPELSRAKDTFTFIDFSSLRFEYLKDGATSKLGDIHYGSSTIRLHPGLEGHDFQETLAHELAHHIAFTLRGEQGHGYYWGYALIILGYEPSRLATSGAMHRALIANRS